MMAIEDAGTIALLLKQFWRVDGNDDCKDHQFDEAMAIYEELRLPRTHKILHSSKQLGKTQQERANSSLYNLIRELSIKFQVLTMGTLPVMLPGATFQYQQPIKQVIHGDEK